MSETWILVLLTVHISGTSMNFRHIAFDDKFECEQIAQSISAIPLIESQRFSASCMSEKDAAPTMVPYNKTNEQQELEG